MSFQKQKHLEWEEGSTVGLGGETKKGGMFSLLRRLCFLEGLINSKITFYPSSLYTKGNIQPGCTSAGRG